MHQEKGQYPRGGWERLLEKNVHRQIDENSSFEDYFIVSGEDGRSGGRDPEVLEPIVRLPLHSGAPRRQARRKGRAHLCQTW